MENPSETRSAGDWLYALAKAGISAIPVAGGPGAEMFAFLIASPATRRKEAWLNSIAERLQQLEETVPNLRDSLSRNEEFVTAVLHASQIAIRTHQHQSLKR